MTMTASKVVSAATAAYGVFALVKPSHLPDALQVSGPTREGYVALARVYGGRDIAISTAALLGDDAVTTAAMKLRLAMDVTDCVTLLLRTSDSGLRAKIAGVTLGWGALNLAALVADRRRA